MAGGSVDVCALAIDTAHVPIATTAIEKKRRILVDDLAGSRITRLLAEENRSRYFSARAIASIPIAILL